MKPFPEELNRKLNLSQWILKFDKHLLLNSEFYEYYKEYFLDSYKNSSEIRKEFHKDFLPDIDSNLGYPSSEDFYCYENFFKPLNYPKNNLANFYLYDDDLNLFKKNKFPSNKNEKEKKGKIIDNLNSNQKSKNINIKEKDLIFLKNDKNKNNDKFSDNKIKNKYDENNISDQEDEINESERNKVEENNLIKKKRSNKSEKNKFYKKESMKRGISKSTQNYNDDDSDSITNNMETYGKQIYDSYDNSESNGLYSNKSLNSYKDKYARNNIINEKSQDKNDYNNNNKEEESNNDKNRKLNNIYFSKKYRNIRNKNN